MIAKRFKNNKGVTNKEVKFNREVWQEIEKKQRNKDSLQQKLEKTYVKDKRKAQQKLVLEFR